MNKIKKYIIDIIKKEIENNPIDNWHGITKDNLRDQLISPTLHVYKNPLDPNTPLKLWTVLEEDPKNKTSYTIFYDTEKKSFGLGIHGKSDELTCLGYYGNFIDTLNGM